jgi:hypothetical protein
MADYTAIGTSPEISENLSSVIVSTSIEAPPLFTVFGNDLHL